MKLNFWVPILVHQVGVMKKIQTLFLKIVGRNTCWKMKYEGDMKSVKLLLIKFAQNWMKFTLLQEELNTRSHA